MLQAPHEATRARATNQTSKILPSGSKKQSLVYEKNLHKIYEDIINTNTEEAKAPGSLKVPTETTQQLSNLDCSALPSPSHRS